MTEPTSTPTPVTTYIPPAVLRDLLTGALTAVLRDDLFPGLACVRLRLDAANQTVTADSTDRYRMVEGKATATVDGDAVVLLPWRQVEAVVKILPKPAARRPPAVETAIAITGDQVTFNTGDATKTVESLTGYAYPQSERLFPEGDPVPTGQLKLDPALLAGLTKIPIPKGGTWRMTMFGAHKPVLITAEDNGVAWRAIVMPQQPDKS